MISLVKNSPQEKLVQIDFLSFSAIGTRVSMNIEITLKMAIGYRTQQCIFHPNRIILIMLNKTFKLMFNGDMDYSLL